jgi:hypothetical protein
MDMDSVVSYGTDVTDASNASAAFYGGTLGQNGRAVSSISYLVTDKAGRQWVSSTKDKSNGQKNTKLYNFAGHRFKMVKVMKQKACVVCTKNMKRTLLRSVAFQCQDCHVVVHKKCGATMDGCTKASY